MPTKNRKYPMRQALAVKFVVSHYPIITYPYHQGVRQPHYSFNNAIPLKGRWHSNDISLEAEQPDFRNRKPRRSGNHAPTAIVGKLSTMRHNAAFLRFSVLCFGSRSFSSRFHPWPPAG
jgi:hypothetical protein